MVGRLIFLFVIVAVIVAAILAKLVLLPLWRKTQEACRARDLEIEAEEERRRKEAEEQRLAEKELAGLLLNPEETTDTVQGRQGNA